MMISRSRFQRLLLLSTLFVTVWYLIAPGTSPALGFLGNNGRVRVKRSSFDWAALPQRYPTPAPVSASAAASFLPPEHRHQQIRTLQHRFPPESRKDAKTRLQRQKYVKGVFQKCWASYRKYAWMKDELAPLSATGKNTFAGWAATLIDSLDTMWIMGLKREFNEAVRAVAVLDWANTNDTACNMFETNIRYLGGLLAAYDLSDEPALLVKAVELGDMLYAGFDTPNRLPPFWLDFQKAKAGTLEPETHQISASLGSFALEFTRLSQVTGDGKYYQAISHITDVLHSHQNSTKLPGLWPTFLNVRDEFFDGRDFGIGAMADSLYEYFPKMHLLLGGQDPVYEHLYRTSMEAVQEHLLFRPMLPNNTNVLFAGNAIADGHDIYPVPEAQHLTCFAGGMFWLGGRLFALPEHEGIGARLTQGCVYAYDAFPTGIMPEIATLMACDSLDGCDWDEDRWQREGKSKFPKGFAAVPAASYSLRPEAIESVFIQYRMTGDKSLLDTAWRMFNAIQAASETDYGNAAIDNVNAPGVPTQRNSMEVSAALFLSSCDFER
jgi:mannosyl-oligosaccharide alpha-1,2-mannosidase